MSEKLLLGLDAGTTSVKGILINAKGTLLAQAGFEYKLMTPRNDFCELRAETYWQSLLKVIRSLIKKSRVKTKNIKALAISSQGETLIPVNQKGVPLRNAIVWLDNRSTKEANDIAKKFGAQKIFNHTGQPEVMPLWPATRILWLKRHEPAVFKQTHKYLLVEDYLLYKLTSKFISEESMVSSTLYYDIHKKAWYKPMLDYLGIKPDKLPEVVPSGQGIGPISSKAAINTGLSTDTLVVSGSYDHPAGAIGAGNIESGMVSETTGASMALCVTLDKPVISRKINLPCQCHSVPGKYFLLPYAQTAGMVLKWFRDAFCGKASYNAICGNIDRIEPGSEGLILLPHLMGSGSPEFNAHAKGVFAGMTMGHTKAHFVRAIMESVAYMLKANLDILKKQGMPIKEIMSLGGASKSNVWNQIKADVTGNRLRTLMSEETPSLGAAILAGVGCGLYKDIKQGCQKLVKSRKVFNPNNRQAVKYRHGYAQYVKLSHLMEPYWK